MSSLIKTALVEMAELLLSVKRAAQCGAGKKSLLQGMAGSRIQFA